MTKINSLHNKYANLSADELGARALSELRETLKGFTPSDLNTLDEHKHYLEILNKLRAGLTASLALNGKNFKKTIAALLSVGEDGVYSNNLRFFYELIQNVDDCDYIDSDNCSLEVKFDTENDLVELTYNEAGFSPLNVFGITGMAEELKNISSDKVEIGEKGIGFKSVFGVAESVLIQSGMFSFEMFSDNFTVPVPRYNNFAGQKGTKLLLKLKAKTSLNIYNELARQYTYADAVLTKNPILFLNKLTKVKFYIDNSIRSLSFEVTRPSNTLKDKHFEDKVLISVDVKGVYGREIKKSINCYRYTMPITYNQEACVSRYSDETILKEKKHNLIAVIPHIDNNGDSIGKGTLYSFLPTQIKLNMPILLHVPYKLDSSREYIDPQSQNKWFHYTNEQLCEFMHWVYVHLAGQVKEKITNFIPKKTEYFFYSESEKANCLKLSHLKGEALLKQKLFFTANGTFESSDDVVSFNKDEYIDDPINLYTFLMPSKKLFIPLKDVDMKNFGVEIITDAYKSLFKKAIHEPQITRNALEMLIQRKLFNFDEALNSLTGISLTQEQISIICNFDKVIKAFNENAVERIKKKIKQVFDIDSQLQNLGDNEINILGDDIGLSNKELLCYLEQIKYNYVVLPNMPKELYFICANSLILSQQEPLSSFATFTEKFGEKNISAGIRIRQISETLNNATSDNSMSNKDYLNLLQDERKSLVTAFGKNYSNYIDIINKSATDEKRFISEILQNADDCYYDKTDENTQFICSFNGLEIKTYYNEDGFTKANVRAITAIGESTKKQINTNSEHQVIGEKGVGFKSVFKNASEVEIHSNGFHFRLTDKRPTVPNVIKGDDKLGTEMVFRLNKALPKDFFTEEYVLTLCLCLRRLQKVTLGEFIIAIKDINGNREICVNDKKYVFKKYVCGFNVTDKEAIEERENNQRKIETQQVICFYIPIDKPTQEITKDYRLYSGLPTDVKINIPLIVDAPFETTTSRERVTQGLWNKIIRDEVYNALVSLLHDMKHEKPSDVFNYVSEKGMFDNAWLNKDENWLKSRISMEELVPLLDGTFVASSKSECWLYLDICHYLFKKNMVVSPQRNIVSAVIFTQKHWQTLNWLGCRKLTIQDLIRTISDAVERGHIADEEFGKKLYPCLKSNAQTIHSDNYCRSILAELPIVPTKPKNGKEPLYIASNEKIYISTDNLSSDEYYLLDEKRLNTSDFYEIFKKSLPELDESMKQLLNQQKYKEKIFGLIRSCDNIQNIQKVSELLANEFFNNRQMMDSCKNDLIVDWIAKIPFKFCSGGYYVGNKFINKGKSNFLGVIANNLCIASEYNEFGEYLQCKSILSIQYSDIDCEMDNLTAEDIEDFLHGGFINKDEILQGFISDGKVTSELIEVYELERLDGREVKNKDYEFPTHPVENMSKLQNHISVSKLNEITVKTVQEKKRVPEWEYDKRKYALDEYRCDNGIHFCQMCQEPNKIAYIEINAVEHEPRYAWNQMQLCLCVKCSKDFEYLRNVSSIREDFESALLDADIEDYEPIMVRIDNKELLFTATHLAEIQEIIKRHNKKGLPS